MLTFEQTDDAALHEGLMVARQFSGAPTMSAAAHLWAVGFDNIQRADEFRAEVVELAKRKCLTLLDSAVVVRSSDGTVTLDGELFLPPVHFRSRTVASFLAGLALAAPLVTGTAVAAVQCAAGDTVSAAAVGISSDFIREVESLMKPGTSALFVLDEQHDMEAILHAIRGFGGTVIRTNVDPERAKLIQSTLAADASQSTEASENR